MVETNPHTDPTIVGTLFVQTPTQDFQEDKPKDFKYKSTVKNIVTFCSITEFLIVKELLYFSIINQMNKS